MALQFRRRPAASITSILRHNPALNPSAQWRRCWVPAALQSKSAAVVFVVGDPVGAGFAQALARPAGLGTGISVSTTDLNSKHLELLKGLAPKAKRIVFLTNPASAPAGSRALDDAAQALGVQLVRLEAHNVTELDVALRQLPHMRAGGVLVSGDILLLANKAKVAKAIRETKYFIS